MKSLDDMREMSASRASLSFLDASRDERLNSETTSNSSGLQEKQQMFKSYDSLDVSSLEMLAALYFVPPHNPWLYPVTSGSFRTNQKGTSHPSTNQIKIMYITIIRSYLKVTWPVMVY